MANDLTIGVRLKDSLRGPCRYFLLATGIFAMISAYFVITEPHFESGGFEDYPWWTLSDSFIIPVAITKALIICMLITFVYKTFSRKNLSDVICILLLTLSLLWSFVASNHPDDMSLQIHTESYTKYYDINDSFSWHDLRVSGHPVEKVIPVNKNGATIQMRCKIGFWRFFGNFGYSYQHRLSLIEKQSDLISQYCVPDG